MEEPRLTIAIPTLDRARHLNRALDSCLAQTVPVDIVVADQGHTRAVADLMELYRNNPRVRHLQSPARTLWQNWRWALSQAETEFCSWLQDDDYVARYYAAVMQDGFDRFPRADLWLGHLLVGNEQLLALQQLRSGPWIPVSVLDGRPEVFRGELLAAIAYFMNWSLSPAVGFRRGAALTEALARIPERWDGDLVTERMVPAAVARDGLAIASGTLVGYWVQHEGCEHKRQNAAGDQDRQLKALTAWLDDLMDEDDLVDRACASLQTWAGMMPISMVILWARSLADSTSRHAPALARALVGSLDGRVDPVLPDAIGCTEEVDSLRLGVGGRLRRWWNRVRGVGAPAEVIANGH